MKFKSGDRVRMKYFDGYAYGEITIISSLGYKVLFDGDWDLAYWYYKEEELELVDKDGSPMSRNSL